MRSHCRLWFRLNYSAESTSLQTDSALRQYSNASVFAHADDVAQCARLQYVWTVMMHNTKLQIDLEKEN